MCIYSDIRDQRYQAELDIGTSDIGPKRVESDIMYIGYRNNLLSHMGYRTFRFCRLVQWLRGKAPACEIKILEFESSGPDEVLFGNRISGRTLMSISELFWYRNDRFQSDIFSSDIGITDVDVGCRIPLTLRSMSMPTYGRNITGKYNWSVLWFWSPSAWHRTGYFRYAAAQCRDLFHECGEIMDEKSWKIKMLSSQNVKCA